MSCFEERINDIKYYNRQMSLGMKDKLFFVDRLPGDCKQYLFIDFGCADGSMINELYQIYPESTFIGYDISDSMLSFAREKFIGDPEKVLFTSDWRKVLEKRARYLSGKIVLILSSVIHEVYSYSSPDGIELFWKRVMYSCFDYIVVRDMMISSSSASRHPLSTDIRHVRLVKKYEEQLMEFEAKWGNIDDSNKNFLHFLLKYRWKINWQRELNENYLPITIEEFLLKFEDQDKYRLDYFEKFRIKTIENQIKSEFNIDLTDTTHIKAIFIKSTVDIPF